MHRAEYFLVFIGQFRPFTSQLSFATRNSHTVARTHADQVSLKIGKVARILKNVLPTGSVGS